MSQLPLKEKESQLTVVEDVHDVSAANARARAAGVIKTRGSRRPRLSEDEKREIARLYADTSTSTSEICARLGIGESSLYRIVQLQGLRLRGRTASSTSPGTAQPAPAPYMSRNRSPNAGRHPELKPDSATATSAGAVRGQAIESDVKQTREPAAGGAKSVTGRQRTAPLARRPRFDAPIQIPAANSAPAPTTTRRTRTPGVARSSEAVQFVVSYLAEQTFQAASALEALQQAQARGATEVTSIVRIA